jgi:hypothetical protein
MSDSPENTDTAQSTTYHTTRMECNRELGGSRLAFELRNNGNLDLKNFKFVEVL